MESDHCITVTHFINPHLFWYKSVGATPDDKFHVLSLLEDKLQELYRNKPSDNRCHPVVGDKVAVNFVAWNRFIRAEVLQKAEFQQEEFIIWATDYGFPLLTRKEHLRNMPGSLGCDIGTIQCGGMVNVVPAEQEYNDEEGDLIMIKRDQWLQKPCDMLEKILADAASVSFYKHFETSDNHIWGDLIITNHKGHKLNAGEYLLKTTHVMEVGNGEFPKTSLKLKTTRIAKWLSNDRKTKLKVNSIKHNYTEYTNRMNETIVGQFAKRKVEDWQARNEQNQNSDSFDTSLGDISHDTIDDITFDDSVSVINKQKNYIGKAGALTKIKQKKYGSKNALPPAPEAHSDAFEMHDIPWPRVEVMDENFKTKPKDIDEQLENSSVSSSTNVSVRFQEIAEKRARAQKQQEKNIDKKEQELPLIAFDSTAHSTASSGTGVSMRIRKLDEMRKKLLREEEEKKKMVATGCRPKETGRNNAQYAAPSTTSHTFLTPSQRLVEIRSKYNQDDTINSHPTTLESIQYQTLDQTTSLLDSTFDKTEEAKSEISVKNVRAKRISDIRKKLGTVSISSDNETITTQATIHESPLVVRSQYKENLKTIKQQNAAEEVFSVFDTTDFKLKPKSDSKEEQKTFDDIINLSTPPISTIGSKELKSGYDDFNMVPAGFDITRLQTYKDEKNHWHRKKTTRYDRVPHDQTVSSDEFLLASSHDQSSSSSDAFQLKPSKNILQKFGQTTTDFFKNDEPKNIMDSSIPTIIDSTYIKPLPCLQQRNVNSTFNVNDEISTSSTSASTVPSQKLRKRRQLKSPTEQLTKIDRILKQHDIEKQLGNTNILDLKLNNTSTTSPRKSLDNTSADSLSDYNNSTASNNRVLIENRNIGSSSSPDKISNEKRLKNVSNYTLMEVKHTDHLPIVEGERKLQTKYIDHLVLAHSSIPLSPIENIADAPFLPEIHEELQKMHINKVYRLQVYSWSHALRGNSLFVINPSRSGKTWSYLPPLCSLVCYRSGTLKPTYGPIAIILVGSSRHVERVNGYCRRLVSGLKAEAPICVPSYGMRNFIETKVQLLNSCGILVTTPSCLLRLLHDNDTEPLFDAERLQHIVIDDMDLMMSRAKEDFKKAVSAIFKISSKSKYKTLAPQLIVTSRDWDGLMVHLIRKSNQPLLLIGNFLEAAVYGRATLSVKLKSSAEKNDTILKFIKKISQSSEGVENRTLIICNEDEEVTNVVEFLQECGYPCLGYYNRSTENELVTIREWKNKVSSQILVSTDIRFREIKIQNAQNLIHYSMPISWTYFTTRFSALAQTYENFVSKNFEQPHIVATSTTMNENVAHSMILLDEDNSQQLPRLVDFMRKHNQIVHEDILAVAKRVLLMREESRIHKGSLLCPQLLEFGECDETHCDNRHELTRFDVISKNDDIPCAGEIRIHVLKVFSPTYYAVRLLHHKPPNSCKWLEVRRSSETVHFAMQLNMHYRNEDNLSLHWPPHLNDICIYNYADNFHRAKILDAPDFSQKSTNVVQSNLKVNLKLIDDGTIISSVKCNEIFLCDDKFKSFPAQAVDIRLMNIVPFDNERSWDSKTTKQTQKWIMEDIKKNYVVQASINFALANTIWVNNVVVMEKLIGIDAYSQVVHLKKSLIEKNFAMIYRGDRKHVRDIAEEYDLLNVFENKIDNDDSDLDYQSCQNDSTNLIKFSSSNGTNSSMESAKTGLEVGLECEGIGEGEEEEADSDMILEVDIKEKINNNDENWDELLDDGQKRDEVFVPLREENSANQQEQQSTTKELDLNCNKSLSTATAATPKSENWSHLPLNEVVKVEIGDEGENGNWENIFLQIIDTKSMNMFDDLKEIIDKHVNHIKANKEELQKEIYEFEPLHNCLVKYNNLYLRAKIHGVFGVNPSERLYRFFLCDYASFANSKYNDLYNDFLYETTEEIVTFMPYQAIHATLVGLQWDRFTKRYQVTKEYLYACAVMERSHEEKSLLNLYNLPIHSYKILMYECELENDFKTAVLFNKTLLDNGITITDEETKHFLEYEIGIEEQKASNNKKVEVVNTENEEITDFCDTSNNGNHLYSYKEFMELAQNYDWTGSFGEEVEDMIKDAQQSMLSQPPPPPPTNDDDHDDLEHKSPKIISSDSEIEEQGHCTSDTNSKKSSISITSSISNCNNSSSLPYLKNLHKRPATTWYENDCMIFLSIHAPDVKNYSLEVTKKTIFFAAEIQGDEYMLNLNLFGSVDPQYVSHEIKGLNIVIRLVKNVFEKWPRLLEETIKYPWLKYNFNTFDSKELEYINPKQRLHTVLENNDINFNGGNEGGGFGDDSDSERELYQTYNPIQNFDDDCDPFS